jgi:hypothetical protein
MIYTGRGCSGRLSGELRPGYYLFSYAYISLTLLRFLPSDRSPSTGPRPPVLSTEARQGVHSPVDTSPLPSPLPTSSTPFLTYIADSSSEPSPQSLPPVSFQWSPRANIKPFGQGTFDPPDTHSPYLALPPSPFHSLPLPEVIGLEAPSHQAYDWVSGPATPETPSSDSLSGTSSWANGPHSDADVELSRGHRRTLSAPSPRPDRYHGRDATHLNLPHRSRSQLDNLITTPEEGQEGGGLWRSQPSGSFSGLALERQNTPGALSAYTLISGVGTYSGTSSSSVDTLLSGVGAPSSTSSSSVSLSDTLGPSVEVSRPRSSKRAVRTRFNKDRVASATHPKKRTARRKK